MKPEEVGDKPEHVKCFVKSKESKYCFGNKQLSKVQVIAWYKLKIPGYLPYIAESLLHNQNNHIRTINIQ